MIELFNRHYSHITLSTTTEALDNRLIFVLTRLLKELDEALDENNSVADIFAIQIDETSKIPTLHMVLNGPIKTRDIEQILEKWPQVFKKTLL